MKLFEITIPTLAGKEKRWCVSHYQADVRKIIRKRFKTKEGAKTFAKELQRREKRGLPAPIVQASPLEIADMAAALELCRERSIRIIDAVKSYTDKLDVAAALYPMPPNLETLLFGFLKSRREAGCRDRTVQGYENAIHSFQRHVHASFQSATTAELDAALASPTLAPISRNTYLRQASVFFGWLKAQKYRLDNPCVGARRYKVEASDPCIYTADESKRLMRAAEKVAPQCVRAYAIALFAGIRPNGITRLAEADILLDEKLVRVGWAQDKTGKKYFAELSDNAVEWLTRYGSGQAFCVTRHQHKLILGTAGLNHGHDILRHTFASHHLAAHQSIEKTAHALNHRGADMLFRHYRAAVKPAEGVRFFQIRPK